MEHAASGWHLRPDDLSFLLIDPLAPSSTPPASPPWEGGSRDGHGLSLPPEVPEISAYTAFFSELGPSPVEAGWAHLRKGLLMTDSPVPMGTTALSAGPPSFFL